MKKSCRCRNWSVISLAGIVTSVSESASGLPFKLVRRKLSSVLMSNVERDILCEKSENLLEVTTPIKPQTESHLNDVINATTLNVFFGVVIRCLSNTTVSEHKNTKDIRTPHSSFSTRRSVVAQLRTALWNTSSPSTVGVVERRYTQDCKWRHAKERSDTNLHESTRILTDINYQSWPWLLQ